MIPNTCSAKTLLAGRVKCVWQQHTQSKPMLATGKVMTDMGATHPHTLSCPACGKSVYRLSLSSRLARWRARFSQQRPFACAECGWQGSLVVADPHPEVIDQLPWFRARAPKSRPDSHDGNSA
jgi:predicted RNA-binding Zn-ribbon protein involved in translation (DUF1610 family)